MANTKSVQIGELRFKVEGDVARVLDQYNQNNSVFSPDDLPEDVCMNPEDTEQEALAIVAGAIDAGNEKIYYQIKALADTAHQLKKVSDGVHAISTYAAMNPAWTSLCRDKLELTPTGWRNLGGRGGLQRFATDVASLSGSLYRLVESFEDKGLNWENSDPCYGYFPEKVDPCFRPVLEEFQDRLDSMSRFFQVHSEYPVQNYTRVEAALLKCKGDGCPQEDEVNIKPIYSLCTRWD